MSHSLDDYITIPVISVEEFSIPLSPQLTQRVDVKAGEILMEIPIEAVGIQEFKAKISGQILAVEHAGSQAVTMQLPTHVDMSRIRIEVSPHRLIIMVPQMAGLPGNTGGTKPKP